MLSYLLHAAVLLSILYGLYRFLLAKETFYQLNRLILVGAIALSFLLPLISIPADWSLIGQGKPVTGIAPRAEEILQTPIFIDEEMAPSSSMEELTASKTVPVETTPVESTSQPSIWAKIKWGQVVGFVYLLGVGILLFNLLVQLGFLLFQMFRLPSVKDGKYRIVELEKDQAPYSFWNSIFINPTKYDWETYQQIIRHEKIHLSQRHSYDILLAEILVVLQWFNPFAWLYRKAVEANLEFLTDESMLKTGVNPESYQTNLVKVAVPDYPLGPTNSYNQSTLKKRIIMMNAKKSSLRSSWKYLFLIPVLGLSLLVFNPTIVIAEVETTDNTLASSTILNEEIEEADQTATAEAQQESSSAPSEQPKRQEAEPRFDLQKVLSGEMKISPSSGSRIVVNWQEQKEIKGRWSAEIEGDEICFLLDRSNRKEGHVWMSTECFPVSAFSNLPRGTEGSFNLKRDAGNIEFRGKFTGNEGIGFFDFSPNESFRSMLTQKGYKEVNDNLLFHCTITDINKGVLDYLDRKNLEPQNTKELKRIAIHGLNQEYLTNTVDRLNKMGYNDFDLDELVDLKIHNVTPPYIDELRSLGLKNISLKEAKQAKIHNVSAAYVGEIAKAGYPNLSFDEIKRFAIHNVSPEFVQTLAKNGYKNLSSKEILRMAIHNVDEDYINELKQMGFDDLDADEIVAASIHNVDIEFIKEMQSLGYTDLSMEELRRAAVHNVDTEYVRELKEMGFNNLPLEEVVRSVIHNVDAQYIRELRNMGYTNLNLEQIRRAAIHNVDTRYVKSLQDMGFKNLSIDEVINASIHNVNLSFVESLRKMGYTNLSLDEIRRGSIHNVDTKFVQGLRDLGYKDIPFDQLVNLRIHNVDAAFIKKTGKKGLPLEEYKKMKIHGNDSWWDNGNK